MAVRFDEALYFLSPQNALSGITDAYGKGEDHVDKMKACSKIVQVMLRTWSGAKSSHNALTDPKLLIVTWKLRLDVSLHE